MNPTGPSRLPKWPFLAGDAALLAAAWLIADGSPHPLAGDAVLGIAVCAVAAAAAGAFPFLADYARRQDEATDDRQRALEALARTTATAAEQIGIVANGFHEIAELAQKNLKRAEQLPQKLQEQFAEFQARLSSAVADEKGRMERELAALRSAESGRLDAMAEKAAKAAADWARVESASQRHLAATKALLADLEQRIGSLKGVAGAFAATAPAEAAPPPKTAEPVSAPEKPARPPETAAASGGFAAPGGQAPADGAAPAPRKKGRKATKAENAAESEKPEEPTLGLGDAGSPPDFAQTAPEDGAPSVSVSADGATRLVVTAYIGIGNKLFIRGEGPGLSWERGVPLEFVSIGKWRWETTEATAPVKFKLYKNDEAECETPGAQPLEPGRQLELTADA